MKVEFSIWLMNVIRDLKLFVGDVIGFGEFS